MSAEARVRFADGFDRPERIAFGLEAPQLALVVAGSLLAWSLFHGPAPLVLRAPLALTVGAASGVLGWGRWQERPLLTWAWLALRFVALPRSGSGAALQRAEPHDTGAGGGGGGPSMSDGPPGAPAGAPPPGSRGREPRRSREATVAAGPGGTSVPAWSQWLEPAAAAVEQETGAPESAPELPQGRHDLGDLDFEIATHALITGRRRIVAGMDGPALAAPARDAIVLVPTPRPGGGHGTRADPHRIQVHNGAERALAPVLALRTADAAGPGPSAPLELDDRAEPQVRLPHLRSSGRMRRVALFALSGGSGRTTLAVEAACLIAAGGRRVAILDLDLPAPGVALRLGLAHPERWDPALLGGDRIASLDDLLVTHRSGARVLAGPTRTLDAGAILPARVAELLHLLERGGTEFVVVDLPGDLGALSTVALGAMDEILVVVTPTARGAQDAYRSTEALRRIGLGDRLRYIVNRARAGDHLDVVMGDLGGRVAARIPFDADLEAGEATHRLTGLDGGGAAASALRRLAAELLGGAAAVDRPGPSPAWG